MCIQILSDAQNKEQRTFGSENLTSRAAARWRYGTAAPFFDQPYLKRRIGAFRNNSGSCK